MPIIERYPILVNGQPIKGYCNHITTVVDGMGNEFKLGTLDRNLIVLRREKGTAYTTVIAHLLQSLYGVQGYGGISVIGNHLIISPSSRNAAGIQGMHEEIRIYNEANRYTLNGQTVQAAQTTRVLNVLSAETVKQLVEDETIPEISTEERILISYTTSLNVVMTEAVYPSQDALDDVLERFKKAKQDCMAWYKEKPIAWVHKKNRFQYVIEYSEAYNNLIEA